MNNQKMPPGFQTAFTAVTGFGTKYSDYEVQLNLGTPATPPPTPAAMSLPPESVESLLQRATALLQDRQWEAAAECCRRLLVISPGHCEGLGKLGVALRNLGDSAAAIDCFRQVIAINPDFADAHYKLGTVYQAQGKPEDALACFESAVRLKPDHGDAHYNLGTLFQARQQLEAAISHFEAAISCNDKDVDAYNNLGIAYAARGEHAAAIHCFRQAIALNPEDTNACSNLSAELLAQDALEESLEWSRRALSLQPDCFAAQVNTAAVLLKQGRAEAAILAYQRAIRLQPESVDSVEAYLGLAAALVSRRMFKDAERFLRKAISLDARSDLAYKGLGDLMVASSDYDSAIDSYGKALAINPASSAVRVCLFFARRQLCIWESPHEDLENIILETRNFDFDPWMMLSLTDSAAEQLRCARRIAARHALGRRIVERKDPRPADRRIRLAYVSGDFRTHPVAMLLVGVLEKHDRGAFEVIGLSLEPEDRSELGRRVTKAFDRFVDISEMSVDDVVKLIQELQIDIAVDLMGFTSGARVGIFQSRPAPVQVNFLGFAGTLGGHCHDYIVADRIVIPEEHRHQYAESVAGLPDTFMPTDDAVSASKTRMTRSQLGLPERAFVFCSFNNSYKFNPRIFDVWMRLLLDNPGSVLWLSGRQSKVQDNLRREANARGVSPDRLVFAEFTETHADHLARLKVADLFLDTLPYNAHTTAVDALRAGLPVLTCLGNAFAARVAASLLTAVGLPELITSDLAEYEARARWLSGNPEELARLRAKLESNLVSAPLFATERYTRHLESAYKHMHERSISGALPMSFEVMAMGASIGAKPSLLPVATGS